MAQKTADGRKTGFWETLLTSALFWIVLTALAVLPMLMVPITVPIGPMSWDTYIYLDAAQRIGLGQVHSVDFSAPVGPLGYYLFAWGLRLFPNAHPLLLAQWCMLAVALPLMALVCWEVGRKNKVLALVLVIPFLFFATMPSNAQVFHTLPSLDGFGIYNRHAVILLYVLVSGLLFMRDGRRLAVLCGTIMLALFLTKITGFLVGGLFGLLALLAGRIGIRSILLAAVIFAVPLLALELSVGMVLPYLTDIAMLASDNQESALSRFLLVIAREIDLLVPAGLLAVLALFIERRSHVHVTRFFDRSFWWIAVVVAGGIIFETQNTGSQEFIFLWPVLVMSFLRIPSGERNGRLAFAVVAAFCVLPTASLIVFKTVRAAGTSLLYEPLHAPHLRNMQYYSIRQDMLDRAIVFKDQYPGHRDAYEALVPLWQTPTPQLYSDVDFQALWLLLADDMVKAFTDFERERSIRIETLATLDFTDPFPWILDRTPTPHLQIGVTPGRTLSERDSEAREAMKTTDGVLRPSCPPTGARLEIEAYFAQALEGRTVVPLTPCWDLLVRPDLLPAP